MPSFTATGLIVLRGSLFSLSGVPSLEANTKSSGPVNSPCPKTYKSLDYTPAERHGTPPGLGLYRSELAPVKVFPDDKRVRLQDLTSEQRGLTGEVQKYIPPRIKAQSVGFFALHLRHPDSLRRIVSVISTLQLGAAMF